MAIPNISNYFIAQRDLDERRRQADADRKQRWEETVLSNVVQGIASPILRAGLDAGVNYLDYRAKLPMEQAKLGGTAPADAVSQPALADADARLRQPYAGITRQDPVGPSPAPVREPQTEALPRRRPPEGLNPRPGAMAEADVLDYRQRPERAPQRAIMRRPAEGPTYQHRPIAAYEGEDVDATAQPMRKAEALTAAGGLAEQVPGVTARTADGRNVVIRRPIGGLTPEGAISEGYKAGQASKMARRMDQATHEMVGEQQAEASGKRAAIKIKQQFSEYTDKMVGGPGSIFRVYANGRPVLNPPPAGTLGPDGQPVRLEVYARASLLPPDVLAQAPAVAAEAITMGADYPVALPASDDVMAWLRQRHAEADKMQQRPRIAIGINLAPPEVREPTRPGYARLGTVPVSVTRGNKQFSEQVGFDTGHMARLANEYRAEGRVDVADLLSGAATLGEAGQPDRAVDLYGQAVRLTKEDAYSRLSRMIAKDRGALDVLSSTGADPTAKLDPNAAALEKDVKTLGSALAEAEAKAAADFKTANSVRRRVTPGSYEGAKPRESVSMTDVPGVEPGDTLDAYRARVVPSAEQVAATLGLPPEAVRAYVLRNPGASKAVRAARQFGYRDKSPTPESLRAWKDTLSPEKRSRYEQKLAE